MAIKASTQITISKVIDVYAVYRYYKLQSSTLTKPSKPTSNPPTGWSDTEPSYVSGSTNTLYFVDCNVYSDKSFSFSEVSKSSSYEAAKDAWNKANNAQNTANSAKEYTDAVSSQYGYRYRKSIIVYGDRTDYYYPVYFVYGNQYISREVMICRGYADQAPSDWNTDTHKGGLTFRVKANYGGWGGAEYKCEILDFSEVYSTMIGDVKVGKLDGYALCIWLRGGGSTGALYNIYSDQPIEYSASYGWHAEVPIIATKGGVQIGWLVGTETNPTYKWVSDNPLTAPNTTHLNCLQALKTANAAIKDVDVEYYLSTSATSLSGGSWSTTAPQWVDGKYMWSRTVTVDGAGNKTYSPSQNGVCIAGAKGNTGSSGKGVTSIVEQYYKSTSATSLSGGSWGTTYPGWENGKYIWTRSVITYTDNTSTTTTAVCVTGTKGDTGATGKGVKSSAVTYQVSTSGTIIPTGTWQSTIPSVPAGSYLWTKTVITYTDNTSTTSYSVGKMGNNGSKGDSGKDAIIISSTAPTNPALNQLWQTASGQPIKRWDGSKWVLHYLSVDNLNVEKLSAICADLGTVTAGVLKSPEDPENQTFMVIDLSQSSLISYVADENREANIKDGQFLLQAKDEGTDLIECVISGTHLMVTDTGTKNSTGLAFDDGDISIWNSADNKNGDNRHINIYNTLKNLVDGDYIISKGTSGIWGYRKWNSGIAEVWCKYETVTTNLYGLGLTVGTPYYPFKFVTDPIVNASFGVDSSATAGIRYVYTNPEYAQMYGWCGNSGIKCWFYVYGIGRWK